MVVGTLDVNQSMSLPDEITGMKPEVIFFLISLIVDYYCSYLDYRHYYK